VLSRDGEPAPEIGLRDTVLIGGLETVRIATTFDNPGLWMVHCHILEHAEAGMMALVEVR
jgi:FtsP/CotA-like multicopper oxidase with cupredoxin domain